MASWRVLLGGIVLSMLAFAGAPSTAGAVAIVPAADAPAIDIYVNPNGNDAAAGTLAAPIRTIAEAWRRVPSGVTLVAPTTIWLAAGSTPQAPCPTTGRTATAALRRR